MHCTRKIENVISVNTTEICKLAKHVQISNCVMDSLSDCSVLIRFSELKFRFKRIFKSCDSLKEFFLKLFNFCYNLFTKLLMIVTMVQIDNLIIQFEFDKFHFYAYLGSFQQWCHPCKSFSFCDLLTDRQSRISRNISHSIEIIKISKHICNSRGGRTNLK